jgi:hypothetical protein
VRDEQDGLAGRLPDPQQLVLQRLPGLRVQRSERFVHQQHLGIEGEAAGDGDTLLHAAGKLVRKPVGEALQTDQLQVMLGPFAAHRSGQALRLQPELDVLARGAPGQQRVLLEDDPSVKAGTCDGIAVQQDSA